MEFKISDQPCLILEAAELVYALVNNIPAKSLTREGPYCIPADQVAEIQKTVTKDLNPEDEELLFYFRGVPVEGREERLSCLACTMLYFAMPIDYHEADEALEYIHSMWTEVSKPFSIVSFNGFTLCFGKAARYTNLSQEICKLPLPPQYQNQLIEVFSGFDWHLEQVGRILRPLAEKLKPLLKPWVEKAAPLREQWREFSQTEQADKFFPTRANLKIKNVRKVLFSVRYFSPIGSPGMFDEETGIARFHMGVLIRPDETPSASDVPMTTNDYTILRLLANPDRIAMLNAMMTEPMNGPALVQKLGLHSGSVFRDLNNMYNAGLLSVSVPDGKHTYSTNFAKIKKLAKQMLTAINPDYQG